MAVDTLTFAAGAALYIVIVLLLGYLGYKRTKQAEDYMLAGRNVHPALIALSYGATFISTSAIVGFGGTAAYMGMGLIWLTFLNIAVGMPLYSSAVMIGGARFIETTFAMNYNVALLIFAAITAIGHDIWGLWKNRKPSLMENRAGASVMLVVSIILAYLMPVSTIARATAMFMGLCASAFLPAFVQALFSKKPSTKAAIASLVVGAAAWFLWTAFVHKAESSVLGISQLLSGQPAVLGMPWQVVDPLIIALPLSAITLAVVWTLDRKPEIKEEVVIKQANT